MGHEASDWNTQKRWREDCQRNQAGRAQALLIRRIDPDRTGRLAGDTARAATTDEVKDLCGDAHDLREVVAEQTLDLRLLKKHDRRWGRPRMGYPKSEKLEIIRLGCRINLPNPNTSETAFVMRCSIQLTLADRLHLSQDHWLEHYVLPGDLEAQIEAIVDHYNHRRYHERLNNVTGADVYSGHDKPILK